MNGDIRDIQNATVTKNELEKYSDKTTLAYLSDLKNFFDIC